MASGRRVIFSIQDTDGSVYAGPGPKDDPWLGFADGKNRRGIYSILCTEISRTGNYGETGYCRVSLQLKRRGEDRARWLAKFLMHPTFREEDLVFVSNVVGGIAEHYFWSYGPFVVGAVAREDGVETKLELNLTKYQTNRRVNGAPEDWWTR
jgi:hypothetical protein